jgi:hypothetical protein
MKQGSSPDFCPPVEEGMTFTFQDENGDLAELEFLGLIVHGDTRYGFFFPVTEDVPATSSGDVVVLEVSELDADGQPQGFELIEDEAIALQAYGEFKIATKDLYDFE